MSKRPLVVPQDEGDVWTVMPTPGYVVKFRNVEVRNQLAGTSASKFFLNVAHCVELPAPALDLDEDAVAALMEKDPAAYKIPISLSDIEYSEDHEGNQVPKVDVLVNSTFFHKRIEQSEFFRQLLLVITCEAIQSKFGVQVDPKTQVKLKNKKVMGELHHQRIRKRPREGFVTETKAVTEADESEDATAEPMDVDDLESGVAASKPRNFRVQIMNASYAQIMVKVRDASDCLVNDAKRLTLKMNDDRVVVLVDGQRTSADFFVPYQLDYEKAASDFQPTTATLTIKCPVVW